MQILQDKKIKCTLTNVIIRQVKLVFWKSCKLKAEGEHIDVVHLFKVQVTSYVRADFAFYQAKGNLVAFENNWVTHEGFVTVSHCKYLLFNW